MKCSTLFSYRSIPKCVANGAFIILQIYIFKRQIRIYFNIFSCLVFVLMIVETPALFCWERDVAPW